MNIMSLISLYYLITLEANVETSDVAWSTERRSNTRRKRKINKRSGRSKKKRKMVEKGDEPLSNGDDDEPSDQSKDFPCRCGNCGLCEGCCYFNLSAESNSN